MIFPNWHPLYRTFRLWYNLRMQHNLLRLGIFVSLAIAVGFGGHFRFDIWCAFVYTTYYFLAVTFLWLAMAVTESVVRDKRSTGAWFSSVQIPLLTGFILTTILFFNEHPAFRVLDDEATLVSTSMSLYLHHTLYEIHMGSFDGGIYHALANMPAVRKASG